MQFVHACPGMAYFPGRHAVHADDPESEDVPEGQDKQAAAFDSEYVAMGQSWQDATGMLEYRPAAQNEHAVLPATAYLPGTHSAHSDSRAPTLVEIFPSGQFTQADKVTEKN